MAIIAEINYLQIPTKGIILVTYKNIIFKKALLNAKLSDGVKKWATSCCYQEGFHQESGS